MGKALPYEARFYAQSCEWKPFTRTKHKCLRCQECIYGQYKWCLENPKSRKKIDGILKELNKQEVKNE